MAARGDLECRFEQVAGEERAELRRASHVVRASGRAGILQALDLHVPSVGAGDIERATGERGGVRARLVALDAWRGILSAFPLKLAS